MQAKIETLKAKNGADEEYLVYPRTLIQCVTNENGDNLEDTLKDFVATEFSDTYASSAEVSAIKDGSTQVGNAQTLDGHEAEYFVSAFELVENANDITKSGFYKCTQNIPFDYGIANVIMVGDIGGDSNIPTQIAFGIDLEPTTRDLIAIRSYVGSSWAEWTRVVKTADLANYLPLTGGVINGNVTLKAEDTEERVHALGNSLRQVYQTITNHGRYFLYDATNGIIIIDSQIDGTNTFNGTASGNFPLNGEGTVKRIYVKNANTGNGDIRKIDGTDFDYGMYFIDQSASGKTASLRVSADLNVAYFVNNANTNRELHHTGNKPTGTYTGNGDATERWINLKSIGKGAIIYSAEGIAIVTTSGAVLISKAGEVSFTTDVSFSSDGSIILRTASNVVNLLGKTYYYISL